MWSTSLFKGSPCQALSIYLSIYITIIVHIYILHISLDRSIYLFIYQSLYPYIIFIYLDYRLWGVRCTRSPFSLPSIPSLSPPFPFLCLIWFLSIYLNIVYQSTLSIDCGVWGASALSRGVLVLAMLFLMMVGVSRMVRASAVINLQQ